MNHAEAMNSKISARARAQRLMNHLTAGVAVVAVAGLGIAGYVSATTIPGATSTSTSATSSTSSSSSSGLSSSSGKVSSSSGSGVAVSGGS